MNTLSRKRLAIPRNRQAVTGEPDPGGRWTPAFPEMVGYTSQGGGNVPADLVWRSSPKQRQEEMTEESLRARRLTAQAALVAGALQQPRGEQPALPAGAQGPTKA